MLPAAMWKIGQAFLGDPAAKDPNASVTKQHALNAWISNKTSLFLLCCILPSINSSQASSGGVSNRQTGKSRPFLPKLRDLLHKHLPRAAVTSQG